MLNNSLKGSKVIFPDKKDKGRLIENMHKPLVSFVIPILNAEQTLEKCLDSILSQDYSNIEIVLVGNGSSDNTYEIAKAYERKFKGIVKVFRKLGPLGNIRTYGIERSSGELIALWDSDVYIPYSKWLLHSVNILNKFPKASTLWIHTVPPPNAGIIAKAYDWFSWTTMLTFARKRAGFWGGGISIFRKKAIEDVGGITTGVDTGEDYDLARKVTMKGYKVIFYNDPVYHDSHTTLAELVRKDLRRSKNFKMMGLTSSTGIQLRELVMVNLIVGFFLSLKNLFAKKEVYFGVVPILLFCRLITYSIRYLLS